MGRHHEVRAAAMAKTGARKSALYARASREVYMAAKSGGSTDPNSNLALRAAMEKYRGQSVPRDVFERALKKAAGGDAEVYLPGRYEAFGPGNSLFIIDTLTDNANRALVEVRTIIVRKGGHMGNVAYNFTETGVFVFKGNNRDEVEEALILGDVDVQEVDQDGENIIVYVNPTSFSSARDVLDGLGVKEFVESEIEMIPNETVTITDEETRQKIQDIIDNLDELEDVQNVFHNVEL